MNDEKDDGLSWAGDESDPTLTHDAAPRSVATSDDPTNDSEGDDLDDTDDDEVAGSPSSSVALVALGIVGGLYALSAVGWGTTAARQLGSVSAVASDVLGQSMYALGLVLATLAPVVWFLVALALTRGGPTRSRVVWLIAGLVLLAPVPFLGGA